MLHKIANTIWFYLTPAALQRWVGATGGRRFLLSLGAGVVSSILVWYGKITPEVFRDIVLGTVGIYVAGNTAQKIKNKPTERSDA